MTRARFRFARRGALIAPPLLAFALSGACGNADTNDRDYGEPPDAALFDPGRGGGSGGYGSGNPGTFECPDEFKACPHEFTYPYGGETSVELRGDFGGPETWQKGEPMRYEGGVWRVTAPVPYDKPVQYKFLVNGTDWVIDQAQPTITDNNNNTNNIFSGTTCANWICNEPGPLPPGVIDWRDAVIYFVFVDRFFDGNAGLNAGCYVGGVSGGQGGIADYQGGDWAGVTQKIQSGYFNDLGVNTLWLTVPLNNASVAGLGTGGDTNQYSGYHGYWPKIDNASPATLSTESCFGSLADLQALVTAAHAKDIRVIYDYAMVHVHNTSQAFQNNPSWFWPNQNPAGNNNCICGQGCSWDNLPDRERCWFTDYLPHWNYTNAAARTYSVTNAIEWIKQTGADGFRLDAIKHVDISWLTELRSRIKTEITATQTPQQRFYMVGETYDFFNRDTLKSYVDPSTKLDGQFDFPLRRHVVEAVLMRKMNMSDMAAFMDSNDYFYGGNAVMSTFIGNHDLPRVIHLAQNSPLWGDQGAGGKEIAWSGQPGLVGEREAYERMAAGFAVILTNRGAPLIYYGDEIGLPGAGDPDNRRFMQWAGLSANQTFLYDRVKALLAIRAAHPATRRGRRRTLDSGADFWAYELATTGDQVIVVVNRSDSNKTVGGIPAGSYDELIAGGTSTGGTVDVPPREVRILAPK